MKLRHLLLIIHFVVLLSCNGTQEAQEAGKKVEEEAQAIIQSFVSEKTRRLDTLNKAKELLKASPDSTNRINFAKSQAAYTQLLIEYSSKSPLINLLNRKLALKLETKEQLLYISQLGYGRINTNIDSIYIYPQKLKALQENYSYVLNGKNFGLSLTDSLLKTSPFPQFRKRLWLAAQLPADSLYTYWNFTRAALNNSINTNFGSDIFIYRASQINFSPAEINDFCAVVLRELKPVLNVLHRHYTAKVAKKYRETPPQYLPIHWLPDGKGVNWNTQNYSDEIKDAALSTQPTRQQQMVERYFANIGFVKNKIKASSFKEKLVEALPLASTARSASAFRENNIFDAMGSYGVIATQHIANNQDTPLAMKGEVNPLFSEMIYSMFSRIPLSNQFWQDEQIMSRYNAPNVQINLLHQAYNDLVYCVYVAGVVTPMQQLYYTQSFPPNLITTNYWKQMQNQLGIMYSYDEETLKAYPGIPGDVLLYPIEHFKKMLAILWSYQWLFQNTDTLPKEFYLPKTLQHGIPLHNLAYQGVRFPFDNLMSDILENDLSPAYMAKYFEQLANTLTDSADNSVKAYPIVK